MAGAAVAALWLARRHERLTRAIAEEDEIGTHSENHRLLGGEPADVQRRRLALHVLRAPIQDIGVHVGPGLLKIVDEDGVYIGEEYSLALAARLVICAPTSLAPVVYSWTSTISMSVPSMVQVAGFCSPLSAR